MASEDNELNPEEELDDQVSEETPEESVEENTEETPVDESQSDEPERKQSEEHQKPLKIHGIMVSLLFALLLLTLVTVGIIIVTRNSAPRAEDFSIACKVEVENALLDAAREITRVCMAEDQTNAAPTTLSVPATSGGVGFTYPVAWSVMTTINRGTPSSWSANLVPGHFSFCQACDGPLIDISMRGGNKAEAPVVDHVTFVDFLNTTFSEANGYSNTATTTTTEKAGTRYVITGNRTGLYTGTFEAIYYDGATQWAGVEFLDADPTSTTTNEAWKVVKESLDFSEIK